MNDGEASKPSYATYVKDRLTGFGGESHPLQYADLVDFPELAQRVFEDRVAPGDARRPATGRSPSATPRRSGATSTTCAPPWKRSPRRMPS